jgi:RP/EB family microtubule-associated protein
LRYRADYEFIANYKLLQNAFVKNRIQRHIDVNKLIRAKYQDNLEFCQWLKAFFDQSGAGHRDDYDGKAVRARGKGGKKYETQQQNAASRNMTRAGSRTRAGSQTRAGSRGRTTRAAPVSKPETAKTGVNRSDSSQAKSPLRESNRTTQKAEPDPEVLKKNVELKEKNSELEEKNFELEAKNAEMETKVAEIETALVDLEKERDFYFGKLRNVELMLQVQQDKNFEGADLDAVVAKVFKVLYATAEEDVDIEEEGEDLPPAETDDAVNTTEVSNVSIPAQEHEVF